jgi:hypothetical protein
MDYYCVSCSKPLSAKVTFCPHCGYFLYDELNHMAKNDSPANAVDVSDTPPNFPTDIPGLALTTPPIPEPPVRRKLLLNQAATGDTLNLSIPGVLKDSVKNTMGSFGYFWLSAIRAGLYLIIIRLVIFFLFKMCLIKYSPTTTMLIFCVGFFLETGITFSFIYGLFAICLEVIQGFVPSKYAIFTSLFHAMYCIPFLILVLFFSTLGSVLFIIPGLLILAWGFFTLFIIIEQKRKIIPAMEQAFLAYKSEWLKVTPLFVIGLGMITLGMGLFLSFALFPIHIWLFLTFFLLGLHVFPFGFVILSRIYYLVFIPKVDIIKRSHAL